jgi:hypothetical protein
MTPTSTATPVPPANDDWEAALALALPATLSGNSRGASVQSAEPNSCSGRTIGRTVWYRIVPSTTGTLQATTAGSSFDTTLALYQGSTLAAQAMMGCNDNAQVGMVTSSLAMHVTAGATYYLQLGGALAAGGPFALQITLTADPTATPTSTSTPTATPTRVPSPCDPRHPVGLSVVRLPGGVLQVTVTAGTGMLHSIQFGRDVRPIINAIVEIPGVTPGSTSGFVYTPPLGVPQFTFYVRQRQLELAVTVPLIVTDDCGPWQTFVGGGPSAFR